MVQVFSNSEEILIFVGSEEEIRAQHGRMFDETARMKSYYELKEIRGSGIIRIRHQTEALVRVWEDEQ